MPGFRSQRDLAAAVWTTWGAKGLVRRALYEAAKRSGRLQRLEARWATDPRYVPEPLTPLRVTPPRGANVVGALAAQDSGIRLYGALHVESPIPPDWHRHPLSGYLFDGGVHWAKLSDAGDTGDIKDLWELARFGWLYPRLRRWATSGDEAAAEEIWLVIDDWASRNPSYLGPHWMCGQETALRAITAMFLADALASSPTSTRARRTLVAELVAHSIGRVEPTIGYALSQRNNHAISEAGFLWTATLLAKGLPDAAVRRRRAASALAEAVADQFAADGSYAQHSPTYQRLALHVLLWCLFVARRVGEDPPPGVLDAVRRSVPFLRSLVAPASDGRVPNLGGNDGALLFDLAPADITDLRPVIAHAAAATGQPSGYGLGPWDEEPAWFGLSPVEGAVVAGPAAETTHALTLGATHAVVRAGPLRHRPAHADQLHTDIWIDGQPVALDVGSYRYTAAPPWGNALAGDDVHNVPRRVAAPQAERAGRFFWRRWAEATVLLSIRHADLAALVAGLRLPDGTELLRLVAVSDGVAVVVDQATRPVTVRWNFPADAEVTVGVASTSVGGTGWGALVGHGPGADVRVPADDHPASGWHAPTYGVRHALTAVVVPSDAAGRVVSGFARDRDRSCLGRLTSKAGALDLRNADRPVIEEVLRGR